MGRLLTYSLLLIMFSCSEPKPDNHYTDYRVISSGCETGNCPVFRNPSQAMEDLEKELKTYLARGYKPIGGVSVVNYPGDHNFGVVMYQAIIK
jgi:hypothetical protein